MQINLKIAGAAQRYRYLSLLAVMSFVPLSYGQVVPDAGVVEPQRERAILPSTSEQPLYQIPSAAERSGAAVDQEIAVTEFVVSYDRPELVAERIQQQVINALSRFVSERNSQLTFSELEQAASLASSTLRNADLLLATALLPPQEVENGYVHLRVIVGVLAEVGVKGVERYKERSVARVFDDQRDEAVKRSALESAMLRVNDMPGITAAAVFSPGKETGQTNMRVNIIEEQDFDGYARLDNYGLESTGDFRILAGIAANNVTGHTDRLSVDAVKTFHPGDLRNARISYEITEPTLRHTFGLAYSETNYDVEDLPFKVEGNTEIGEAYVNSSWYRRQTANIYSRVALSTKRADQDVLNNSLGVDRLTVLTASLIGDHVDTRFKGLQRASVTWHQGIDDFLGSMDKSGNTNSLGLVYNQQRLSGEFEKVSATYSRLQTLSTNNSLLFRYAMQHSDDNLSSLERMAMSGPYTVRAYEVGEFTADSGSFLSAEWRINGGLFSDGNVFGENSWSDVLELTVFYDWANGRVKNGDGSKSKDRIQGVGIGVSLTVPDYGAYAKIEVAKPTSTSSIVNRVNQRDNKQEQLWVVLGISF